MYNFTILGFSHSNILIVLDSLYRNYGNDLSIEIIENVNSDDILKFEPIDNIKRVKFEDWGKNNNPKILGVVKPHIKETVYEFFNIDKKEFFNVIDKNSIISPTTILNKGIQISPNVSIAPNSSLGNFVTISRNSSIGHDVNIEEYVMINPGVNIAGFCNIGKNVSIGMGTNILENVTIGENAVIGAGSVITKNIPANVVAYGSPAKIIRDIK